MAKMRASAAIDFSPPESMLLLVCLLLPGGTQSISKPPSKGFFGFSIRARAARALGQAKGEFNEGLSDSRRGETEADLDRGGQTETAAISTEADVEGMTVDEARVAVEEE